MALPLALALQPARTEDARRVQYRQYILGSQAVCELMLREEKERCDTTAIMTTCVMEWPVCAALALVPTKAKAREVLLEDDSTATCERAKDSCES